MLLFLLPALAFSTTASLSLKMSTDDELGDPPASINPYEVLEIDEKASADEVKSAYRKKALKHHPGRTSRSLHINEIL